MKHFILAVYFSFFGNLNAANDHHEAAKQLAKTEIKAIINDTVIDAVMKANDAHKDLKQSDIDALDKKWRNGDEALIKSKLENKLSTYLQSIREKSAGKFTEIFVMDNKGLNVGQSDKTSDYWQGDEAKWKQTYLKGVNAVHISDIEGDESTQTFQFQVSIPVANKDGQVIGAITVGVNAESL